MARRKRNPKNPLVMKNFMAPATLLAQLQELSEEKDVSESEIIRRAVKRYIADAKEGELPVESEKESQRTEVARG